MFGPSRAGKTYLVEAFTKMGLRAADLEKVPGLLGWRDDATGAPVQSPVPAPKEWYQAHHWLMDRDATKAYLAKSGDLIAFAHSWNIMDCLDLFDQVFFMYVPPAELERRMMIVREGHKKQQDPIQIAFMLERHQERLRQVREKGLPVVDVSQTPERIYHDMVRLVTGSQGTT